jgi:hypothetical protein
VISSSQTDLTKQTHVDLSHTKSADRAREPDARGSRGNFSKMTFFTLRVGGVGAVLLVRPAVAVLLVAGGGEIGGRHSGSMLLFRECCSGVVLVVLR